MTTPQARRYTALPLITALAAGVCLAAEDKTAAEKTPASSSSAAKLSLPTTTRPVARSSTKGPLPDPILLDGSTQQADKKPENGMLGEFELPGDDNAPKGSKVGGGPQNPNQPGGGQQQQPQGVSVSLPNPLSLPQTSGGAQGPQGQQGQMAGAQGAQGGGATGGQEQQQASGAMGGAADPSANTSAGGPGGPSDPNATADGIQVAGLSGEGSPQNAIGAGSQKPGAVAIGDSSMRIQTTNNAPNDVVGAVAAGQTQQMDQRIGTGGGKSSGAGNNSNRGAERGRAMPAGL